MQLIQIFLIGFVGISFLIYGVSCLSTKFMSAEFKRFGLTDNQRKLTGILQILGGAGTLLGFLYRPLQIFSIIGISALMFLGWIVRLKIKDSFIQSMPSFLFFTLCAYLTYFLLTNG